MAVIIKMAIRHWLLRKRQKALEAEGVETELFQIGAGAIQDCIDCGKRMYLHR